MDMECRNLKTFRGNVKYWVSGVGNACLVFTHGATMEHGLFEYQIGDFAGDYKIITWDVPAHGLSRPYINFSLHHAAEDLLGILKMEGVEKAHLVGQSMGGYISQILAASHPEVVSSFTAVGSSPIQLSYYSKLDRWLLAKTPDLLKFYRYQPMIRLMANQIAITDKARAYAYEALSDLTMIEISTIMTAVYQGLIEYDKGKLAMPVMITYGNFDRTGKVKQYCNNWAKNEKRLLRVIPQAAHNANMDNPEAFNAILKEFLGSIL